MRKKICKTIFVSDANVSSFEVDPGIFRFTVPGATRISIPIEETNECLNKKLKESIANGTYLIGNLIVPQKFEKTVLRNNKIIVEEVEIRGRKIPMAEIRKKMLKNHREYMRLRSNAEFSEFTREKITEELKQLNELPNNFENNLKETLIEKRKTLERTRHLMFWHDGSTLACHSHILMTFNTIYDPAVHLTDEEYFNKYGLNINIQSEVEKPFLYIMARCPSNEQQILYIEERLEDIFELKNTIELPDGINIKDIMRMFKGDSPARQFEAGQQKGGNYFCVCCAIHSNLTSDFAYAHSQEHISLQDRISKIRASAQSVKKLQNHSLKLYDNLKRSNIEAELRDRNIKTYLSMTQEQLRKLLDNEMHGMQRLPSLMFNNPLSDLSELNLPSYEILPHEPLHDISNHIKNLFAELAHHVPPKYKEDIKATINKSFNGKEAKNSSDYRKSLLFVGNWLLETLPKHFVTNIIITLAEIQEISYLPDKYRTPQKVFRLNNLIFIHAMLIAINLKKNLKTLTERKMFGAYFHAITRHASDQYRILSGRSANTEKEEAFFTGIKTDTKLTSNYHPEGLITNALVRAQARERLNDSIGKTSQTESYLHNLYDPIKKQHSNTIISFQWIRTYPHKYQKLLEKQSDFLLEGNLWWKETDAGIEFLDINTFDETSHSTSLIQLFSFRSTSLKQVEEYLKSCWEKCTSQREKIPAYQIKVFNDEGNCSIIKLYHLHKYSHLLNSNSINETASTDQNTSSDQTLATPITNENTIQQNNSVINENILNSSNMVEERNPYRQNVELDLSIEVSNPQEFQSTIQTASTPFEVTKTKQINDITPNTTMTSKPPKSVPDEILSIKPINCDTLSNSSKMLVKIFGETELIKQYDMNRKYLKSKGSKHGSMNHKAYMKIIAEIEVKLKNKREELHAFINETDASNVTEDHINDSDFTNDKSLQREEAVKKLSYIKKLLATII